LKKRREEEETPVVSEVVRPEFLIARLTSDNEVWRVEAEGRLIQLGAAAVPLLIGALHHANPAVRIHAAHALARLKDPRGLAPVVEALGDRENNGAVAIAAEKALVEWGSPAAPVLLEAAREGAEHVRARAVRALGRMGGAELEAPLRALLSDASSGVRTQAAVALTQRSGAAAVEAVAPLLADPDKWVRYEVAEALVKVGSVRGEAALREASEDPEEKGTHVQFWAEELLDQIQELRRTGAAFE
jgi:HEAT repeat protein